MLERFRFIPGLVCAVAVFGAMTRAQVANPGSQWERVKPEDVGYSSKRLDALTGYLATIDTTAMMAVHRGRVIFEYGDVAQQGFQLTSVRKSLLALLYGKYVANGTINLDATLEELGIDDVGGLLPGERRAKVRHLIASRSGVFHKNVNPNGGDSLWAAPPRGTQAPGTYFIYNNWDFNVAGFVFETLTGLDMFDAFEQDVARPIGMQDFDRTLQVKERDNPTLSNYPAYRFSLTVRDMARVGQLMLQKGIWNGKEVVPGEWIAAITSLVTPLSQINPPSERYQSSGILWGYGNMWWVWDDHGSVGPFQGAYSAIGNIGQFITVLPALDLVVAHKTIPLPAGRPARAVRWSEYQTVLMQLTTARCRGVCP